MEVNRETQDEEVHLHPALQEARAERVRRLARKVEAWMRLAKVVYIKYGFYADEVVNDNEFADLKTEDALKYRSSTDQTKVFRLRRASDIVIISHEVIGSVSEIVKKEITHYHIKTIVLPSARERKASLDSDQNSIQLWNELYQIALQEDYSTETSMIRLSERLFRIN